MSLLQIYLTIAGLIGAYDFGFASGHGDKGAELWILPLAAGLLWPFALIYWTYLHRVHSRQRHR